MSFSIEENQEITSHMKVESLVKIENPKRGMGFSHFLF